MPIHINDDHLHGEHLNFDGTDLKVVRSVGQSILSSSADTTLTSKTFSYQANGTFSDSSLNTNFTTSSDGKLTYDGTSEKFLFSGSMDLEVSLACHLTIELYKNGVATGFKTDHDFTSPSKVSNISITGFISSVKDDYYEVFLTSTDTDNVIATINTLRYNMVQI